MYQSQSDEWRCSTCGEEVSTNNKFCPNCGAEMSSSIEAQDSMNIPSPQEEVIDAEYVPSSSSTEEGGVINKLKNLGFGLLGLLFLAGMIFVSVMMISGTIWASEKIYPWLVMVAAYTLPIVLLIFVPLSFVRRLSGFAGVCLIYSSYLFGLLLWVYSILLTLNYWGGFGLVLGLIFTGGTVLPAAVLATLLNADWNVLLELVIMTVLVFGVRLRAIFILDLDS